MKDAERRYRRSEKGRATAKKNRTLWLKTPIGIAYNRRRTMRRSEWQRQYNAKRFVQFKKALTARIECLRHTSPEFREARIQEILNWAGSSHSYWVDTEIQNACA